MFKFVPDEVRRAWWPVSWPAATDEGEVVTNRIEMRFVLQDDAAYQTLTTSTAAAFDARWAELDGADREDAQRRARAEYVQLLAEGWRGIADEAGGPLPWTPELIGQVMQLPGVIAAVLAAHAAARAGARPNG